VVACAFVVLILSSASPASAAALNLDAVAHCALPASSSSATLKVVGNRVENGQGQHFIYYGISVFGGLQDGSVFSDWFGTQGSSLAQIEAAPYWHANTVRIQVSEAGLFGQPTPGFGVSLSYLSALCRQVQLARAENMQVVINDQTEFQGYVERDPTLRTIAFWRVVGSIYANDPGVSFDVFNEPRLLLPSSGVLIPESTPGAPTSSAAVDLDAASTAMWRLWQRGGTIDGVYYAGMQALVTAIRAMGVRNVIWLEGPDYGGTLSRLSEFPITGSNLVYATHHVPFGRTVAASERLWRADFGYVSSRYAIVDGEWAQFASPKTECRPSAYTIAPAYLGYLHAHGVGLVAWSLQAGSLVNESQHALPTNITYWFDPVDYQALLQPNRMYPDYSCSTADAGEGAGQLVFNFFRRYDTPEQMLEELQTDAKPPADHHADGKRRHHHSSSKHRHRHRSRGKHRHRHHHSSGQHRSRHHSGRERHPHHAGSKRR
jgi:hypothetical protein